MGKVSILSILICLALSASVARAQDQRSIETRVADLLARMPAADSKAADRNYEEMYSLGPEGLGIICNCVVQAGSGNDTNARFTIDGLSTWLSASGNKERKELWEKIILERISTAGDDEVRSFFISQLGFVGGDASLPRLNVLLGKPGSAEEAARAIIAIGKEGAVDVLLQSLDRDEMQIAAQVLNGLASLGSSRVTGSLLKMTSSTDPDIRSAAYRALAATGSKTASEILISAAKDAGYGWDITGATASLISLASAMGAAGNTKDMDKVLKLIDRKTTSVQYKIAVLDLTASYHGEMVNKQLLKAMKSDDLSYRAAAMRIAASQKGAGVTQFWIDALKRFSGAPRAEIASMLGQRRDPIAEPSLAALLGDREGEVRQAAAAALGMVSGKESIPLLLDYLLKQHDGADQDAAAGTLVTLLDRETIHLVAERLGNADPIPAGTLIGLLSWSGSGDYFAMVCDYTDSDDEGLSSAAYRALKNLATVQDIPGLTGLLTKTRERYLANEIRSALVASVSDLQGTEEKASAIISHMTDDEKKGLLVPVISRIGGKKAAEEVLKGFESGDAPMREICFEALLNWPDHYALDALYEICRSGDRSYADGSFSAYVSLAGRVPLPDEQKLLYIKKILPLALTIDQKESIINTTGNIRTFQSLILTSRFLDDDLLAPAAAASAIKIAMPQPGVYEGLAGTMTRNILERSITYLMGPEREYEIERVREYLLEMPAEEGFVPMFNGIDLGGWQGLVGNPVSRAGMSPADLALRQKLADSRMHDNWSVRDGMIWFSGKGDNLCSVKLYGDFEMLVDWKITSGGDSGIYLRGTPQVQIWDIARTDVGAEVGSGGLYNNVVHPSKPLVVADNPTGEWNTLRIIMAGEHVSVWLNGILVVDSVVMENYWDRSVPIFPVGPIELQAHGSDLAFRDIYVREISGTEYRLTPEEKEQGFIVLFNGKNLDGWNGDKTSYIAEEGNIVIRPDRRGGGNLYTEKEYSDFVFRFEFMLTPGSNNGLGIRSPLEGDPAYVGMELQILDNEAPVYAGLKSYQYHGSVYGVIPARRGYLKPTGEWNYQEVEVRGSRIKVTLNGEVIVDGDIADPRDNGTMDGLDHPGLKRSKGHIVFCGHDSVVKFRNIRIREF